MCLLCLFEDSSLRSQTWTNQSLKHKLAQQLMNYTWSDLRPHQSYGNFSLTNQQQVVLSQRAKAAAIRVHVYTVYKYILFIPFSQRLISMFSTFSCDSEQGNTERNGSIFKHDISISAKSVQLGAYIAC